MEDVAAVRVGKAPSRRQRRGEKPWTAAVDGSTPALRAHAGLGQLADGGFWDAAAAPARAARKPAPAAAGPAAAGPGAAGPGAAGRAGGRKKKPKPKLKDLAMSFKTA